MKHQACLIAIVLLLSSGSAQGLWETHSGSDARANHCDPIPEPYWSPPGLEWVLTKEGRHPDSIEGNWVIPAEGTPWASDSSRLLVTVSRADGHLHLHNETFETTWSTYIGDIWPSMDAKDVDGTGVPQLIVASRGPALFDLKGEQIRTYDAVPASPGLGSANSYMWPAMGDFTNDGGTELVFPGSWEWHAFRADGEMIARYLVVEERDTSGWNTAMGHHEDGRDYLYLVTANEGGDDVDIYKRLHKLTLEENPAYVEALESQSLHSKTVLEGAVLPYQFEHVWMRELHADAVDDELRFYDLTGDGNDEIILEHNWRKTSETGGFTILDLDGNVLYDHQEQYSGHVAIGDMNGDGVDEVVTLLSLFVGNDPDDTRVWDPPSYVSGVQWNGQGFEEIYRFMADEEFAGRFLVLCDVNGDGADELLVALGEATNIKATNGSTVGNGTAKLLTVNGTVLWEYRLFFGHPWRGVVIDDFTGDGAYEFIIPTAAGQVLVFSPYREPSMRDYQRPFEELLERDNRTPSAQQVESWLAQVEGLPENVDPAGADESQSATLDALPLLGLVALLLAVVFNRRVRH